MKVTRSPYSLRISGNNVWCMREHHGHSKSSKLTTTTLAALAPRVGRPFVLILFIVSANGSFLRSKLVIRFMEERSFEIRNVRSSCLVPPPPSTVTTTDSYAGNSGLVESAPTER